MGLTENQFGILLNLNDGEKRFSDLAKKVKKASLAKELKFLTKAEYVTRRIADSSPPSTYYRITNLGHQEFIKGLVDRDSFVYEVVSAFLEHQDELPPETREKFRKAVARERKSQRT